MPNKNKALISLQLVCIFKPGISIERTHQSNQPVLNFSKRPVCLTVNYIMIEVLINISITEGGAVHLILIQFIWNEEELGPYHHYLPPLLGIVVYYSF